MSDNVSSPDLRGFLEAAGQSLADAQGALTGGALAQRPALAIADATLEVKAGVTRRSDGTLALDTISGADARRGDISPGLLSTIQIHYIAVAGESGAVTPVRTTDDVIRDVRDRPDIGRLERILGRLRVDATFVPDQRRWVASVLDGQGRVVRALVLPDTEEGGNG